MVTASPINTLSIHRGKGGHPVAWKEIVWSLNSLNIMKIYLIQFLQDIRKAGNPQRIILQNCWLLSRSTPRQTNSCTCSVHLERVDYVAGVHCVLTVSAPPLLSNCTVSMYKKNLRQIKNQFDKMTQLLTLNFFECPQLFKSINNLIIYKHGI